MNPLDLTRLTADQLRTGYASGDFTPVDATHAALAAAELGQSAYNAVASIKQDEALEFAAASAARWAANAPLSDLDGVPVSVKDSFPLVGHKRWHGSSLADNLPPSVHNGAPVRRLLEAGAVPFVKTTMPDFGLLGSGISSQFGIIRNPWDPACNPAGSSSGAGALLAIGAGPLAIGTDTGGSVRMPAAMCGVVGLKPTQGLVAYDPPKLIGVAGPMARTVADTAALLRVVGQPDLSDHLCLPGGFSGDGAPVTSLAGVSVGVFTTMPGPVPVDPEILAVVDRQAAILESLGATVTRVAEPISDVDDWAIMSEVLMTRGLPELLRVPEDQWENIPAGLRESLLENRDTTAMEHITNEKKLEASRAGIAGRLQAFDYVLSPASPVVSYAAELEQPVVDGHAVNHMAFTAAFNLTHLPAGTVPVAMSASGMPISVQVSGHRFNDAGVLSVMAALESTRGFDLQYPFALATQENQQ
ncbi:amidase [Demequina aurantiaca]|uniref:amidase n=1 Tax=Demequina aurantiaca TaxID=676200 RepID=UPI003D348054